MTGKDCPHCGAHIQANATWCLYCRRDVPRQDVSDFGHEPDPNRTTRARRVQLWIGEDLGTLRSQPPMYLDDGVPLIVGRLTEGRIGTLLNRHNDVGRKHLELHVTGEYSLEITDQSRFGTFLRGQRLPAGQAVNVELPVDLRLGARCWLRIERAEE